MFYEVKVGILSQTDIHTSSMHSSIFSMFYGAGVRVIYIENGEDVSVSVPKKDCHVAHTSGRDFGFATATIQSSDDNDDVCCLKRLFKILLSFTDTSPVEEVGVVGDKIFTCAKLVMVA